MRYIYIAKCSINNKCYVGQTKNFGKRVQDHISDSKHFKRKFHNAIRKHGSHNFIFSIIEECEDHLANEREVFWILHFDSFKNGYNSTTGGDHFEHSEETLVKIGNASRGKPLTTEHKQKLSDANKGKVRPSPTAEIIEKRASAMRGKKRKPFTDEHKQKLSKAHQNPSEERRKQLSAANKGKTASLETREKLSKAGKCRIVSEETARKISNSNKGKKKPTPSAETIEKRAVKLRGQKRTLEQRNNMCIGRKIAREKKAKDKIILLLCVFIIAPFFSILSYD
jgi:group I intron endonuclease